MIALASLALAIAYVLLIYGLDRLLEWLSGVSVVERLADWLGGEPGERRAGEGEELDV